MKEKNLTIIPRSSIIFPDIIIISICVCVCVIIIIYHCNRYCYCIIIISTITITITTTITITMVPTMTLTPPCIPNHPSFPPQKKRPVSQRRLPAAVGPLHHVAVPHAEAHVAGGGALGPVVPGAPGAVDAEVAALGVAGSHLVQLRCWARYGQVRNQSFWGAIQEGKYGKVIHMEHGFDRT